MNRKAKGAADVCLLSALWSNVLYTKLRLGGTLPALSALGANLALWAHWRPIFFFSYFLPKRGV